MTSLKITSGRTPFEKIEMNMPADMGGMMDDMMGSGYYGDQSQNEDVQDNQMDLGDIGISSDMITEYLSDYIREVRVMVWWEEDFEETGDYVELLTHVVNPSGVVTDPEVEEDTMMQNLRSNRGLTLIEVVISLGILVFMGAMTWQTIAGSLMLRDILEYEDTVSRSARVAMDQIKGTSCCIPDIKQGCKHLSNCIHR